MSAIDWILVVLLNGSIIVYALVKSRDTETSSDWFLAGKTLPWWLVGLSLYATVIDSTDLVVDGGAAYKQGVRYFILNWVGVVGGWFVLAHFVVPSMYRAGMYTNAEYLEARFGPTTRVVSVLVQVLYRTVVMGMIGTTNYLTLTIVCGWSDGVAWGAVGLIALLATLYTVAGGLKSVAITDALQSIVMIVASILLFSIIWNEVGGWSGLERTLAEHDADTAQSLLHVGSDRVSVEDVTQQTDDQIARRLLLGGNYDPGDGVIRRSSPGWLICVSFVIAGFSYSLVNHTQSMRLLGAKSEFDLKLAVVPAGAIMLVATFLNLSMGLFGRALVPDITSLPNESVDAIFPVLVRDFTSAGLKGIVVAGIFAAAFSTYDSIGSTASALITRDLYARICVKDRDDQHYLTVGRWVTPLVIFGSFLYVPLLLTKGGMVEIYLGVVATFVVPLMTVYLIGSATRAHRSAGTIGLLVGVGYGILALLAPRIATGYGVSLLPTALLDGYATGPTSFVITALTMIGVSGVRGWTAPDRVLIDDESGWLRQSKSAVETGSDSRVPAWVGLAGLFVVGIGAYLSFVIFW